MARQHRLEYPGAIYPVINCGNYRGDVFATAGTRAAFEKCVFEAVARSGWVLHALVVMRNHFHLAIETPSGNLVAGMPWLQATFANRFNGLRGERGHWFQGRDKALLVEPGEALGLVCHYLHLNPVRAGVLTVERLGGYRASSYWHFCRDRRPEGLTVGTHFQGVRLAKAPSFTRHASSDEFKANLFADEELMETSRAWDASGTREIQEKGWTRALAGALRAVGRTEAEAEAGRKSAPWKVAVAAYLKATTQADNRWLAKRLHLGALNGVSFHTGQLRRGHLPEAAQLLAKLYSDAKI